MRIGPPKLPVGGAPYTPLVPLLDTRVLAMNRSMPCDRGDAGACFGQPFETIELPEALRLPGGPYAIDPSHPRSLDPLGGRFGKGICTAEADIHPDDWFLTCHFVDDMVMPGTLMYECCAHTSAGAADAHGMGHRQADVAYEPIAGIDCRLKCRGPVTPATRHVHYTVEIKEMGYHPEPYVIADAHMHADGHYIVFFKDMSMQMTGVTQTEIEAFWHTISSAAMSKKLACCGR
jgi:3-hydroxymyristoyl/3-hydroxydecanoyl-(acyl carrier protein) dehydratase